MTVQNVTESIPLKTRAFTCFFETNTGYLRRVKSANAEVVRAIYGAVRDKNWNTVEPRLSVERLEHGEDGFWLEFTARCDQMPISFFWKGIIQGQGSSLEFRFDGQAGSAFLRNRIGLCILHPIVECAGKPCRTQHTDGTWREGHFPLHISPHQPFKNLRALSWRPSNRVQTEIRFEGDVFEMEDQRNWTDASFKTYSTPLELPFPVEVAAGEEVHQRVVLSLGPEMGTTTIREESRVKLTVSLTSQTRPLAKLGLGVASHGSRLSGVEQERLVRLGLNHLRVDLHFSRSDWKAVLKQAHDEAVALRARLQCALFLNDSAEQCLLAFRGAIEPGAVDTCLVFHEAEKSTSCRWFELAERNLASHGFRLATGTNAYFAELNRQRPPRGATACYSLSPQVHAFDYLSLVETLEAQSATVESARQFCDRELVISPITLRPRFNPNATSVSQESEDQLPTTVDPRQRTLFGAAWTLGTLAQLLPLDRVESLTFYETTGWRGLMETEAGSPKPALFGSAPGEIFPMYYVFEAMAGAHRLLPVNLSEPQLITALACRKKNGQSMCLLANLTRHPQRVELDLPVPDLRLLQLEDANVSEASKGWLPAYHPLSLDRGRAQIALGPNAWVRLEF